MGNVLQAGQGQAPARQAVLGAGIPSLDTGVGGFLSLCSWSLLGCELKRSCRQPLSAQSVDAFFSVVGEGCVLHSCKWDVPAYNVWRAGEDSTGGQAGNSTVLYINGGCCSEYFTKQTFFSSVCNYF